MTAAATQLLLVALWTQHECALELYRMVEELADAKDARLVQLRLNLAASELAIVGLNAEIGLDRAEAKKGA